MILYIMVPPKVEYYIAIKSHMIMRKSLQYSKLRTKKTPPDHKSA